MFLQYAAPGAVVPFYSLRLEKELGFTPGQIGLSAATQAMAALLAPLLAGQIADRWLPAERCLTIFGLAAGALLWLLAGLTTPAAVFVTTLASWLALVPMLTLSTSITFAHLANPQQNFGSVRLWGTVGWMIPGWLLGAWFSDPQWLGSLLAWVRPAVPRSEVADAFRLAGLMAAAVGLYGLTLPPTPPQRRVGSPLAPLAAWRLLRGRSFAVLAICLLGVCWTIPFSTQGTPLLLTHLGIPRPWLGPTLTLTQTLEVVCLALLPMLLLRLGLRGTMLVGLASWGLALGVLAVGRPIGLVIASLGLHGVCICCFLVTGQVYVNSRACGDVRVSVQGLFTCISGMGLLGGNLSAGWVRASVKGNFALTFAVAAFLTTVLTVIFLVGFMEDEPAPHQGKDTWESPRKS